VSAVDILGLTSDQLADAAKLALPSGAGIAHRLYPRALRAGEFAPESFPISATSAAAWRERFTVGLLEVARVADDGDEDGTAKAVLKTSDGFEIECVRIPMRHGPDGGTTTWTLCLSSQVGCRMGCTFCETGRMGLLRNLTAAEIVSQVVTARAKLGWQARNLVFMGMGEALDNADHLLQALEVLTDKRGLAYSHERITVCTSGHAEGIARLAALGWKRLNLSISLNSAEDRARSRIMPVNRRTPLAELQRLLAAYPQRRNFTLGVNYCLLPDINDRREDAAAIAAFCAPLGRVLVNLIPYNPGSAPVTRAPSEDEITRFIGWLREDGLPVRRRLTKGRGIMAACGQLGNVALRKQRSPHISG
jgi:23S rRNA (adenine2503-C2)-methyltransferase